MKKAFIVAFCALCAAVYVCQAQLQFPNLESYKNDCKVFRNEKGSWTQPVKGLSLKPRDMIRTGENSSASVRMAEKCSYRIKSLSEIVIGQIEEAAKDGASGVVRIVNVLLNSGTLTATLEGIPSGTVYNVQSPVATAGATGTEFCVVHTNGVTDLSVTQSSVEFTSIAEGNRSVSVAPYQRSTIAPWKDVVLQDTGSAVLSEKILGKKFVADAAKDVVIGVSAATREDALRMLQQRLWGQRLANGSLLGEFLNENPDAMAVFFDVIEKTVTQNSENGSVAVRFRVKNLADKLGVEFVDLKQGFEPVSETEYGAKFGAVARLTTLRAAKVDALRRLAEQIYGSVIDSKTTIKDMAAEYDIVTTRVEGVVKGAELVGVKYYSDGSVCATMRINGALVKKELDTAVPQGVGTTYVATPVAVFIDEIIKAGN